MIRKPDTLYGRTQSRQPSIGCKYMPYPPFIFLMRLSTLSMHCSWVELAGMCGAMSSTVFALLAGPFFLMWL